MNMRKKNGFSLVEVLIVVAIAAGVVIVVGNIGTNVGNLNGFIASNLQSKSDIAQTLQIMTSEIRSAEPSAAGAYPIVSAGTSSFSFFSDINDSGAVDYVSYFLASGTIYRAVIAPTGTPATYPTSSQVLYDVIDDVSLLSSTSLFTYYGASYTGDSSQALASPVSIASVRLIKIAFSSETSQSQNQGQGQISAPQYFSTLIDIRNLDSN